MFYLWNEFKKKKIKAILLKKVTRSLVTRQYQKD